MNATMRMYLLVVLTIGFALLCQLASGGYNPPWDPDTPGGYEHRDGYSFTLDYYYNQSDEYYYGDSVGGSEFEIWEVGAKLTSDKLYFSIWINMPQAGADAEDSYTDPGVPANMSPGDLWITVGTTNPFAAGFDRHAIALTDRSQNVDYDSNYGGNIVPQKYNAGGVPDVWPDVIKGDLYKDADYATGTFEDYQQRMKQNDRWYWPDDQDGDDDKNSYMTLIKDFDPANHVSGRSSVGWSEEGYWDWDADITDWVWVAAQRITGEVYLSDIGLSPGMDYSLFVSSECGNDGAAHAIPEPSVVVLFLVGAGLAAALRKAQHRRSYTRIAD